jgi:hypothetical protein
MIAARPPGEDKYRPLANSEADTSVRLQSLRTKHKRTLNFNDMPPKAAKVADEPQSDQDAVEKARLAGVICKTWNINELADIFGTELRANFKQDEGIDISVFSLKVLEALEALSDFTSSNDERDQVEVDLEAMCKTRKHATKPMNRGNNLKEKNEKFLVDINKLIRDVKRKKGHRLSALERLEASAYDEDVATCKFLGVFVSQRTNMRCSQGA